MDHPALAQQAIDIVNQTWGHIISPISSGTLLSQSFKFHYNETAFLKAYTPHFNWFFEPTLRTNLSASEAAGSALAFCTPSWALSLRSIHVNVSRLVRLDNVPMSEEEIRQTYAHEYIHFVSHPNFYPLHYRKSRQNAHQVEGITEYFTYWLFCHNNTPFNFAYEPEFDDVTDWIGTERAKSDALIEFLFLGQEPPQGLLQDLCAAPV